MKHNALIYTAPQFFSVANSTAESILKQMQEMNNNISELTNIIQTSQSFWNSQLFAAIIGASSAIMVLLIKQLWNWKQKRKDALEKIYKWIAEQNDFWNPRSLFDEASRTGYGCTTRDDVTGGTTNIPEKTLGEKMVIELRSHVKYWKYPSHWLRKLFKK